MEQKRLFRLAVEVIHLHATYVPAEGWTMRLVSRRPGESWADCGEHWYMRLTSPELLDVASEVLAEELRLL